MIEKVGVSVPPVTDKVPNVEVWPNVVLMSLRPTMVIVSFTWNVTMTLDEIPYASVTVSTSEYVPDANELLIVIAPVLEFIEIPEFVWLNV